MTRISLQTPKPVHEGKKMEWGGTISSAMNFCVR